MITNFRIWRIDYCKFALYLAILKVLVIGCFLLFAFNGLFAQDIEYRIKAGFLGKFSQFVEWPSTSVDKDSSSPFIIAVIGENPFGTLLENLYRDSKIKNRSVEIRYLKKIREVDNVHILFISGSERKNLNKILERTSNKPILTVSDSKGFCEQGVLINLYKSDDYIRFEINYSAVLESGLHFSSRLLKLARIINWSEEKR